MSYIKNFSGQVYKLRNPGAKYLASLSTYDSTNPTKDWGFPELSIDRQIQALPVSSGNCEKMTKGVPVHKDLPSLPSQLAASKTVSSAISKLCLKQKLYYLLVHNVVVSTIQWHMQQKYLRKNGI